MRILIKQSTITIFINLYNVPTLTVNKISLYGGCVLKKILIGVSKAAG